MLIVRNELIKPVQFSGTRIEGDHRTSVKVITGTRFAIEIRRRVCHRYIDYARFGIERQRRPHRTAADEFGVGLLPGFGTWLAIIGYGIESPNRLAVRKLESADPSLYPELASGGTDNDKVFPHYPSPFGSARLFRPIYPRPFP